uniref:Cytochrome c biogenesis protein Ccs1 n=1 Tax=Helminthocladia australis TaxID=260093 RepID=A0A1G4NTI7_9FLOR|nr:Cytochrome c biogenesis protein ccs1 [Helminthocladia australis]SCW21866.1 Cytochrome c biogenesis protein ccs1 [Helminthocladia australis]
MRHRTIRWKFIKIFSNLSFSIMLLLTICFMSVLGTIIEQNKTIDYYQLKYPMHNSNLLSIDWKIITNYKLDEVYTSWIFLSLLFFFGLSLITCTFSTQLPSLKNARRWKMKQHIKNPDIVHDQSNYNNITQSLPLYALNKAGYYTFYQQFSIYGYKGLSGRVGPIFVHMSIILLLIGSLASLFGSFYIQEMVPVGEDFSMHNITNAGIFSKIPNNITGQVQNFKIDYYDNQSIKQFYSSLYLKKQNTDKIITQTIEVNKPLHFEGLTIYQTDWKINGLRLKISDNSIQIPIQELNTNSTKTWFTSVVYSNDQRISLLISSNNDNINCYNEKGILLQSLQIGKEYTINHIPIEIVSVLTSTGLQIKADPGINIIYGSFGALMLSTLTSYISFSQIWIVKHNRYLYMQGKTNRAQINFEKDISRIRQYLIES